MATMKTWMLRALFLLPAVLLTIAAIPRLVSGLAQEAAFPVPAYIEKNFPLPRKSYDVAATALSHAPPADGATQIARAEAAHLAGNDDALVIPILENGLSHDPASARGWTLLSEVLRKTDRARSAKALAISLEIAPYDFFLAGRRARDGALVWDVLAADARPALLRVAAQLWNEASLHGEIVPLLNTPGGAALMTRALADDPNQIRELNRWVTRQRFGIGRRD
jgi:hypothetical protein